MLGCGKEKLENLADTETNVQFELGIILSQHQTFKNREV